MLVDAGGFGWKGVLVLVHVCGFIGWLAASRCHREMIVSMTKKNGIV